MSSPERVAAGDGQHWSENGIKFLGRRSSAATSDTSYWTKNWGLVRQWLFIIKQIKWFENIRIVVRSQMLFKGKKEILFRNQDKTFASFTFVSNIIIEPQKIIYVHLIFLEKLSLLCFKCG